MSGLLRRLVVVFVCLVPLVKAEKVCNASLPRTAWTSDQFPNPQKDLCECGRGGEKSWICDPSQILEFHEADRLDSSLKHVFVDTRRECPCSADCDSLTPSGYRIAIALVPKITFVAQENSDAEKLEATKSFADHLQQLAWDGFSNCDQDVIVVLSRADKKVWVSVGTKAIHKLTDYCAAEIFDEEKRHFFNEDWYIGLDNMIVKFRSVFLEERACTEEDPLESVWWQYIVAGIGTFLLVILVLFVCGECSQYPNCVLFDG